MKTIKLRNGDLVLVDDKDFEWLNKYKWHLSSQGYARTQVGRGKFVTMHKLINKTPVGMDTDHINRNKLDNRRKNIRTATRSLNVTNSGIRIDNTSGCKGVDFYKRVGKWRARLGEKSLGYFKNFKDAVIARKGAEII